MFIAFRSVGPNRVREGFGLDFEDFQPGQIFHHRPGITVTQQDNIDEALSTLNQAAIHYDDHYAAATEFRRPLVVSTITLQRAVGMGWKTFGRRKRIETFRSIAMVAPIFGGDTLYTRSTILETGPGDSDAGLVTVETILSRQDKVDAAKVTYEMLIYRRDQGPFAASDY